jgi:GNAT acetyltransferase-like protein
LKADILERTEEPSYEELVLKSTMGMLYHGVKYKRALEHLLEATVPNYLVVKSGKSIVGALPLFTRHSPAMGDVANSLPFWGSHGGFILDPHLSPKETGQVSKALIAAHEELLSGGEFTSSTIISSSFDKDDSTYSTLAGWKFTEYRTGQILEIGPEGKTPVTKFAKASRNAVRRAQKAGLETGWGTDLSLKEGLSNGHREGMLRVGGLARPESFFLRLDESFIPGDDYRIYYAKLGSEFAALLLVFYYKETIEYFTPVTFANFRSFSPMNLLIYEVVRDAVGRKMKFLNFGGTRENMDSVYRFKRSFGATDKRYHYYNILPRGLTPFAGFRKEDVVREFPWFYVVPFNALEPKEKVKE